MFRIIVASIRSMGDSYDDGFSELAEALSSLYKAEIICNKGPWQSNDDVEVAPSLGAWINQPGEGFWPNQVVTSSVAPVSSSLVGR